MENIIICCLGKYLEVSGTTDVLGENIFGPIVMNSAVKGTYY